MKGKQLRKAVLLGMAMSMAVWTTGMAEDIRVRLQIAAIIGQQIIHILNLLR